MVNGPAENVFQLDSRLTEGVSVYLTPALDVMKT